MLIYKYNENKQVNNRKGLEKNTDKLFEGVESEKAEQLDARNQSLFINFCTDWILRVEMRSLLWHVNKWSCADCTYPSSPTTKGSAFNLIHLSCNGSFFLQLIYCHQIAISIQINESLIFIHFHWNFHLSRMAGWRWTAIRISICSKYSAVKWHLSRVLSSCDAMRCEWLWSLLMDGHRIELAFSFSICRNVCNILVVTDAYMNMHLPSLWFLDQTISQFIFTLIIIRTIH